MNNSGFQAQAALAHLDGTSIDYLVYQPPQTFGWRIALRKEDYATFTSSLLAAEDNRGLHISLARQSSFTMLEDVDPDLIHQAPSYRLFRYFSNEDLGPYDQTVHACTIERWDRSPDAVFPDDLANSRPFGHTSRIRWNNEKRLKVEIPSIGCRETVEPLVESGLRSIQFPIDVVYMWVNDDDPQWRSRRDAAATSLSDGEERAGDQQFRQHDELRYSLRSIAAFAPWVRRVYLVTDGQRPDWLSDDDDAIRVVDHKDFWSDPDQLPVFNSHAIASQLHRIEGLAEHYIVVNDDVFLGSPSLPNFWFSSSGQPVFHSSSTTFPPASFRGELQVIVDARLNAVDLVDRDFRFRPATLFQHTPIAQSRSLNAELEQKFPAEFAHNAGSKFRSREDLETIWLHHYYGFGLGRTQRGKLNYRYIGVGRADTAQAFAEIEQSGKVQAFCINDSPVSTPEDYAEVENWLLRYFPGPSKYERMED